jgi:hypothetical protein
LHVNRYAQVEGTVLAHEFTRMNLHAVVAFLSGGYRPFLTQS